MILFFGGRLIDNFINLKQNCINQIVGRSVFLIRYEKTKIFLRNHLATTFFTIEKS